MSWSTGFDSSIQDCCLKQSWRNHVSYISPYMTAPILNGPKATKSPGEWNSKCKKIQTGEHGRCRWFIRIPLHHNTLGGISWGIGLVRWKYELWRDLCCSMHNVKTLGRAVLIIMWSTICIGECNSKHKLFLSVHWRIVTASVLLKAQHFAILDQWPPDLMQGVGKLGSHSRCD